MAGLDWAFSSCDAIGSVRMVHAAVEVLAQAIVAARVNIGTKTIAKVLRSSGSFETAVSSLSSNRDGDLSCSVVDERHFGKPRTRV
jgi:hypothetical protein